MYLRAHSLLAAMGLLDDMDARDFWTEFIWRTRGSISAGVLYRQEPMWPVKNESACVNFNEIEEKQNGGGADLHSENDSFEIALEIVQETC